MMLEGFLDVFWSDTFGSFEILRDLWTTLAHYIRVI